MPEATAISDEPASPGRAAEPLRLWAAAVVVAGVAVMVYSASLPGAFQYDDLPTILRNPAVADASYLPDYFTDPELFSGIPGNRMYRPVLLVTYLANHAVAGFSPLFWHLTNVLLHALNAVLTLLLARGLSTALRPGRTDAYLPLLAGLAFALHPVHSEVVNYISSRSGALATSGFLGALVLHLAWTRGKSGTASRGLLLAGSLVCFALGLGGKEIAVAVVPCVFTLEILDPQGGGVRRRLLRAVTRTLPLLAVAIAYMVLRKHVLGQAVAGVEGRIFATPAKVDLYSGGGRTVFQNLITQSRVFWMYAYLMLVPVDLAVDRFVTVSASPLDPAVIASAVGIVVLLVVLVVLARKRPLVTFCGAVFLFGLAPTSVIPLNVIMNEHRVYLPGIGFAILTALVLGGAVGRWRRAGPALVFALGVCYACVIVPRSLEWQDPTALWEANVRSSPRSFRGHNQLGAAYHAEAAKIGAKPEAVVWIDRAIEELEISAKLYPDWYHAHLNLGIVHRDRARILETDEDFEAALGHFRKCRSLTENEWGARLQIATTYGLWKKYEEALSRFESMAEEDREPGEPRKTLYLFPMAKLNLERGEYEAAERLYREIVAVDSTDIGGYEGLATTLARAGRRDEGVAVFEDLLRRKRGDPYAHIACARFLDGLEPPEKRKASAHFQRALQLGYAPSPEEFDRFLGN